MDPGIQLFDHELDVTDGAIVAAAKDRLSSKNEAAHQSKPILYKGEPCLKRVVTSSNGNCVSSLRSKRDAFLLRPPHDTRSSTDGCIG